MTTKSTLDQPRVARNDPSRKGGEWRETARPQGTVAGLDDAPAQAWTQEESEHIAGLLQAQTEHAGRVRHTFAVSDQNWGVDDTVNLAGLVLMENLRKVKIERGSDGVLAIKAGYAATTVVMTASKVNAAVHQGIELDGGDTAFLRRVNTAAMGGYAAYRKAQERRENDLGRPLTEDERDALAHDLRENWHDAKHRPPVGFHRAKVSTPRRLEVMQEIGKSISIGSAEDALVAREEEIESGWRLADPRIVAFSDNTVRLEMLKAQHGASSKEAQAARADVNRSMWPAVAAQSGLPMAAPGRLDTAESKRLRTVLEKVDHPKETPLPVYLARAYEDRTTTPTTAAAAEALFSIMGATSEHDRADVVEYFLSNPTRAEHSVTLALRHAKA